MLHVPVPYHVLRNSHEIYEGGTVEEDSEAQGEGPFDTLCALSSDMRVILFYFILFPLRASLLASILCDMCQQFITIEAVLPRNSFLFPVMTDRIWRDGQTAHRHQISQISHPWVLRQRRCRDGHVETEMRRYD